MSSNAFPILLVDDDQVDAMAVKRAFRSVKLANELHVVESGEEALEFLRREGRFNEDNAPRPGLILLDINMPGMGGLEALRAIKAELRFRTIPVILLTTSKSQPDRLKAYQTCAQGYIVKPVEYEGFLECIRTIDLYWSLCEAPPPPDDPSPK